MWRLLVPIRWLWLHPLAWLLPITWGSLTVLVHQLTPTEPVIRCRLEEPPLPEGEWGGREIAAISADGSRLATFHNRHHPNGPDWVFRARNGPIRVWDVHQRLIVRELGSQDDAIRI